jgi:hypothetical protein
MWIEVDIIDFTTYRIIAHNGFGIVYSSVFNPNPAADFIHLTTGDVQSLKNGRYAREACTIHK